MLTEFGYIVEHFYMMHCYKNAGNDSDNELSWIQTCMFSVADGDTRESDKEKIMKAVIQHTGSTLSEWEQHIFAGQKCNVGLDTTEKPWL